MPTTAPLHRHTVDQDAVAAAIEQLRRTRSVPGASVAITDADGLLLADGFGTADLATDRPTTTETSYLWFSLTKVATATAALRLVDEGRLDLDAPVADLVPGIRPPRRGERARVRHLLDHTAGFANPLPLRWIRPAGAPATPSAEVLARLLDRHGRPRREVGGEARYSNLGYLVLGEVIAAAAGTPFEDHLRQAVLEPAGMDHTGFAHHPGCPAATGYVRAPRVARPALAALLPRGTLGRREGRMIALQPFLVDGASYGGLVGSVVDASRLARLHLGDGAIDGRRILDPATARRMRHVDTPGRPFDLAQGWFRHRRHRGTGATHVEHLGTGGGFSNVMRLYPDDGIAIVVMTNTTGALDHDALLETLRAAVVPRAGG